MNWQSLTLNEFDKQFYFNGKLAFPNCKFEDALKFHKPGLAPVKDKTGWYHINESGKPIYKNRYERAFGYYYNRASVISKKDWMHIDEVGNITSKEFYNWCGNYQEDICSVQGKDSSYFHINLDGQRCYQETYKYVGDFKYGFACVMDEDNKFTHVNKSGSLLHAKWFLDLGIYHKGFAVARDEKGWFHIDFNGREIYRDRFSYLEPFYNGFAFAQTMEKQRVIVSEIGQIKSL